MPVVAMLASVLLTLTSGLVLAATFLWWRWWHTRPTRPTARPSQQGREFGAFENVMHHLRQECGHHNMSLVLRFHERLDCERLRDALRIVQTRHVLLQSTVVLDHRKRPAFKRLDDPPPIPLVELAPPDATADASEAEAGKARGGEESEEACRAEDQRILARELNTGFEGAQSLLRCTVIQPPAPPIQRTRSLGDTGARSARPQARLVITVAHDLMDGRSVALLGVEIIELYRHPMSPDLGLGGGGRLLSPRTPCAAPIPPPIEAVMLPAWMPRPIAFVSHLLSFLRMHRCFVSDRVQALPHTARNNLSRLSSPSSSSSWPSSSSIRRRPLWTTGVVERRLSCEETARLQRNGRKMGASMSVQLMTAAFLATTAGALKRRANVWGVQVIDMRRQLMAHQARQYDDPTSPSSPDDAAAAAVVAPTALGQFLSNVDLCHHIDPALLPPPSSAGAPTPWEELSPFLAYFREQCGIVRARLEGHMRRGRHLTSLVFAQYLAAFSAYHSRHFTTPFPCPAFSMSNVGSMDDAQPGGPLADVVRALNGRHPMLHDMSFGVSAASSFPFVSITALTLRGSLRVSFNYPTNTVAPAAIAELADAYLHVLRLAATEGAHG